MFSLTKQERLVLFCLALILLCGTSARYVFKRYPSILKAMSLIEDESLYKKIDINRASVKQIEALPYVGEVTAQRIVAHRDRIGRFETTNELKDVEGIGEGRFQRIRPYLKEVK